MSINLFIPAAGLGTRLRPLTELLPKPLLPLAGISVLERNISAVSSALDVDCIGINTHWLPETIESWAEESNFSNQIELFYEQELLGTGGALNNASKLLEQKPFLVFNGDVLMDIDWAALLEQHRREGNLVTLAVQDREHERRVGIAADGQLLCIDPTMKTQEVDGIAVAHWTGFSCAAIYEPEFLQSLPEGESHVVPYWLKAEGRVGTFNIGKETAWLDMGNADTFAQATFSVLEGEQRFLKEPLKIPYDCQLEAKVIVEEGVEISHNVRLENSILLPGANITDGEQLENCIAGPDFRVQFTMPEKLFSFQNSTSTIGQGGSCRRYYRQGNEVLLQYSAFESSIERQIELTKLFLKNDIAVPKIFSHQPLKRQLVLQDLGDITLREWLIGASAGEANAMMEKILDELIKFQFCEFDEQSCIHEKPFDHSVLLWETSYFLERCVQRLFGLEEDFTSVKAELEKLAEEVDQLPKKIMHRDFQSENVMIHDGRPYFIDFQGAHFGAAFYDLASMLRDPYTEFNADFSQPLIEAYFTQVGQKLKMSTEQCHRALTLCGMQRHMQALGAYGFLSTIRGKEKFQAYVSPALDFLLAEVEEVADEFPNLLQLLKRLKEQV